MKKILFGAFAFCILMSCNSSKPADETSAAATVAPAEPKKELPTEIADDRYMEFGRRSQEALKSGNLDPWFADFADNAVYIWNRGDSLAGKEAIMAYWKKRRTEVIDSINFITPIFLPVKVNQPQQPPALKGVWLFSWYLVDAKYKNGKHMRQWIHTDAHFNENDKIDRLIQYIDNSVILAAQKK